MINYIIGLVILVLLVLAIRHAIKGHHCSGCSHCGEGGGDCGCGKGAACCCKSHEKHEE